jgi:multidrug resistance efflux pump
MLETASELENLRAALAAAETRAATAEADLAQARAVVSTSEAMIAALNLEIALLKRDKYGRSAERTARLRSSHRYEEDNKQSAHLCPIGATFLPMVDVDDRRARAGMHIFWFAR